MTKWTNERIARVRKICCWGWSQISNQDLDNSIEFLEKLDIFFRYDDTIICWVRLRLDGLRTIKRHRRDDSSDCETKFGWEKEESE